jgi:hypothetical protein
MYLYINMFHCHVYCVEEKRVHLKEWLWAEDGRVKFKEIKRDVNETW